MPTEPSILCPVDFSPCSELALERACELARVLQQPIELLHVYQLQYFPEPALTMGMGATLESLDFIRARVTERAEEQRERVEKAGLKASVRVLEGSPAHLIAERAKAPDISLVVMGTHGRNVLGRALLGSVAERVLRTARVPVMTVRHSD